MYAESVSTADVSTVFSGETNNTLAREMRIAGLKAESRAEREAQQQQHQNNASSTEEEEGFPETIQAGAKRRVSEAVKAAAAGRPRITQDGHRRRVRFTSDETKELQRLVAVHGTSECNWQAAVMMDRLFDTHSRTSQTGVPFFATVP